MYFLKKTVALLCQVPIFLIYYLSNPVFIISFTEIPYMNFVTQVMPIVTLQRKWNIISNSQPPGVLEDNPTKSRNPKGEYPLVWDFAKEMSLFSHLK